MTPAQEKENEEYGQAEKCFVAITARAHRTRKYYLHRKLRPLVTRIASMKRLIELTPCQQEGMKARQKGYLRELCDKYHYAIQQIIPVELRPVLDRFTPDQQLTALSWKQPYAELMKHGKVETRTWATNKRGWVLICASRKSYNLAQVTDISASANDARQVMRILSRTQKTANMHHGHAIAIGKLVDCRPMRPEDEDKCYVAFNPQLFCHVYESVTPIKPFPWKGCQGWKEVSQEVKDQIILMP